MEPSASALHPSFAKAPAFISDSYGNYLKTEDGIEIFDASGGAAVACLGHNDSRVKDAIVDQLSRVAYCYPPSFTTQANEDICRFLSESTGGVMSKVYVVSSGTEAVEAALKMARQFFTEHPEPQMQRTRFIARKSSFHGNTLGSLATGFHAGRRAVYEDILAQNVSHVSPCYPYRNMEPGECNEQYVTRLALELDREFRRVGPHTVCGFIAETVSGSTLGCAPPVPGYLQAMKEVCDRYGALFILDEVMSGMGRCGTLHTWQQEGVTPDLQTVAKGLGAGYLPIGALMINSRVANILKAGTGSFAHSQTYQGHPVACASACAVQKIIQEENLMANVREQGEYLGQLLKDNLSQHKNVGDIRGRGLFWGIEFVTDKKSKEPFSVEEKVAARLHNTGLQPEHRISMIPSTGNVDGKKGDMILLAPAYNVSKRDIEVIVERTTAVIRTVLGE